MRLSRAALQILFRCICNVFHRKTDKVLHKDLQCLWVLTIRLLNILSDNWENNGDIEILIKELRLTIDLLASSNETAIMIFNNLENRKGMKLTAI